MKKINLITTGIILTILIASYVQAFGVSTSYWRGNPLTVYPGEKTTVSLALQNMVGDEDVKVKAIITRGSEIASIEQDEYLVKAGTKDTEVPVKIEIPSNVTSDINYTLTVSFHTISSAEGGTGVVIGTGMDTTFDVLVKGAPPSEAAAKTNIIWIIVAIIIVIVIAIILLRRKK